MSKTRKGKVVSYNKWGYIFLMPFIIVFIIFQLIPLVNTIRYSFYQYFRAGLDWIGPNWVGFENYAKVFGNADIWTYAWNTILMWIMGFVPQIIVSLVLGSWFSDQRLRLKFSGFFKTVIYLPNLIMASAFAMLFFTLFSAKGPINSILVDGLGILKEPFIFFDSMWATRILVAFMNFLMWFGNTTILLMAGIMGIDGSLFEAAEVDGATPTQVFFRITLPLLRPILVYVMITSLIGGLQMFDVPQILTNGDGTPYRSSMTMIMYLNKHLFSRNYGLAGALSVFLFIITGALSVVVYKFNTSED
ncbi:MAG: sugar ABC transporter permease [Lachnospiraceae bacterium]|nr:sugar ABC transporter permease [Lachnospiraceae bacterium]